jgi:glycogen(starch) synthase
LYGTWLIKGEPATILVNCQRAEGIDVNAVKKELWERFGVDSLGARYDYDEPLVWGWAVGKLIARLAASVDLLEGRTGTVAHCHEWLAGFALLHLKAYAPGTGTVFTTHATMLGRTLCASGRELYGALDSIQPEQAARELGISEKFTMERACARHAHVFTTVSAITGAEAEALLGRKPDILTLNGLDASLFPTYEEVSILHQRSRERIRDFLEYYFFSHYTFNLDETLVFFITGRFEFHNKGLDIFTQALGKLNERLRAEGSQRTIVAFFWVPWEVHGIKTELLEGKAVFNGIQSFIDEHAEEFTRRILRSAPRMNEFTCEQLLTPEFIRTIQRQMASLRREGNAPFCTHNIPNEENQELIRSFRAAGLNNSAVDPVKVIFYPVYLTGSDGLLDLPYAEAVAGAHLGVFPSYYEPWGYTPVEAMAFGVPAITTDLAGFGQFMAPQSGKGVFVLSRKGRPDDAVVTELAELLALFAHKDKFGRNEEKTRAKELTQLTDWNEFITYYVSAHVLALARAATRSSQTRGDLRTP